MQYNATPQATHWLSLQRGGTSMHCPPPFSATPPHRTLFDRRMRLHGRMLVRVLTFWVRC